MPQHSSVRTAVRLALFTAALPVGFSAASAFAQNQATAPDAASEDDLQTVVVSGTRIQLPGLESSSPVYSVGASEIQQLQQPEVEKIFRNLPITVPSDGQNVNNGTAGVATINLRGLGSQRNLIMIDGKRVTPFNFNGRVDTSTIPTALIDRIDIITGGASAVYGSDAISGAINFIMKRNFEGVAIDGNYSQTGESDGKIKDVSVTAGSNVADGRGNFVVGINYAQRDGVQLGARPLGQLGIVTADGSGLSNFLNGQAPTPPADATCGGPNSVAAGGSTTTLPTRVAIAGGPGLGQFRSDGTLGANCSVFNFNPYNYYQTPQTRYGASAIGHLELNDHAEVYTRIGYNNTRVRQQIAPSGVFGSPFWTPLANPFISAQARTFILNAANAGRVLANPTVTTTGAGANWRDINNNNVVDAADYLNIVYRRRTVEFGERSTTYENTSWNFLGGVTGAINDNFNYDVSFQRGQSARDNISAGYTNVANIALAVDALSTTSCVSGGDCVPLNLFGGFGAITPAMAAFSSATAIERQDYSQQIISASVNGSIPSMKTPWAENPVGLSLGAEYREEKAETIPDECLKLAPASCLGGAGGNTLPIAGGFNVKEVFGEAIVPLISGAAGAQSLDLELGYRFSDYNPTGNNNTWKYGLTWRPVDQLLVRAMRQRAARAPNVGELAAPNTTALDNAVRDPCSIAQPVAARTAALTALCRATGQTAAQVFTVEDITAGQINAFAGTDLTRLPKPESADTTTIGLVWTPDFSFVTRPTLSVDYYDIKINDYIGSFGGQEILDSCYVAGRADQCSKIIRVGGTLTLPGSGVQEYTTNLKYLQASGLEIGLSFGVDIGDFGNLRFQTNLNKYLTQESQSSDLNAVIDCLGHYGNQCGNPIPEMRWVQRVTWSRGPFDATIYWRHLGSTSVEPVQVADTFPQFRSIASHDYIDLAASWDVRKNVTVRLSANNVFDKDPPVVGNEAGTTSTNSGNTFPSVYDTLGRVYAIGVNVKF